MLRSPKPCERAPECNEVNPPDPASRPIVVRVKFEAHMTGTANDFGMRVLKTGAKRTVLLQGTSTGEARLVKRFHSPGLGGHRLLGALGDRRRAALEARALRRALAAGLPVPSPGNVERSADGGWELSMTAVSGAQTLSEILSRAFHDPTWPRARLRALAERIGALLRQVEAAGFLHADPHPANVIVDPQDELCLVDLARSRVERPHAAVRRGLVRALSRMREDCPRSFRRRIALAWLGPDATPEWSRRVEAEATGLRVQELEARVGVWRRTSSATEVRSALDGPGSDALGTAAWVRECPEVAPAGWVTKREVGTADETALVWKTLVRAKLHGIPACEPRAISLQSPHTVEYLRPTDDGIVGSEQRRTAEFRLAYCGLRAVAPDGDPFVAGPDGAALLIPHARLEALEAPRAPRGPGAPEARSAT